MNLYWAQATSTLLALTNRLMNTASMLKERSFSCGDFYLTCFIKVVFKVTSSIMYTNQSDQIRNSTKSSTTESEKFLLAKLIFCKPHFPCKFNANIHKRCPCQILIGPHIILTLKWVINTVYNKRE